MEKPKTLEQLRAEKERAETQLAQEQHKLERLENRKNIWNSVYKPQFRQKRKRSRSPAGPRRLRDSDTHKRIAVPKVFCVLREHLPAKIPKRQSTPF